MRWGLLMFDVVSWVLLQSAFTSPRLEPPPPVLAADCLLMGVGILLLSTRNGRSDWRSLV